MAKLRPAVQPSRVSRLAVWSYYIRLILIQDGLQFRRPRINGPPLFPEVPVPIVDAASDAGALVVAIRARINSDTPSSAIRVSAVRRKSCNRQSVTSASPSAICLSTAVFILETPLIGMDGLVREANTKPSRLFSPWRFTFSTLTNSTAVSGRGTMCGCTFLFALALASRSPLRGLLLPSAFSHFVAPLTCNDQQFGEPSIGAAEFVPRVPERSQLVVG